MMSRGISKRTVELRKTAEEHPELLVGEIDPDDKQRVLKLNIKLASLPNLSMKDKQDPAKLGHRINEYFNYCLAYKCKPTVSGLALALHIDHTTLKSWAIDRDGYVMDNPNCRDMIKEAYRFLNASLEGDMVEGTTNPIPSIFLLKNHFGYKDQSETVITGEVKSIPSSENLIAESELLDD